MSSQIHGITKESTFGGDKKFLSKTVFYRSDTRKFNDPTWGESSMQGITTLQAMQSEAAKFNEEISNGKLEHLYESIVDASKSNEGRKICCDEQPLDFSKKPVQKDESLQTLKKSAPNINMSQESRENHINNVDYESDSHDADKVARLSEHTHVNRSNAGTMPDEEHRKKFVGNVNNFSLKENVRRESETNLGVTQKDEQSLVSHSQYSVPKSSNLKPNYNHSYMRSPFTSEEKNSGFEFALRLSSQRARDSNGHLESGYNISKEINDQFHTQEILEHDRQPSIKNEHQEAARQINNSVLEQRTSPRPTFNHYNKNNFSPESMSPGHLENFCPGSSSSNHSVNLSPGSTSPNDSVKLHYEPAVQRSIPPPLLSTSRNHLMPIDPARLSFGATGRMPESNGMNCSYIPVVYPTNHIANFMDPNSSTDYSGFYPYPSGTVVKPPFNPMYGQSYHPPPHVGPGQRTQKNKRPFKDIDPSVVLSHIPKPLYEPTLSVGPVPLSAMKSAECNRPEAKDSSPRRFSPDSPCIANGSSGELSSQDNDGECPRKKIRRVPPDQKDAKYFEKRRKNNEAAKRSRDQRREKEDQLAIGCERLMRMKIELEAKIRTLEQSLAIKELRLQHLMGSVIAFKLKCQGHMLELYEENFKPYLSAFEG